MPNDASVAYRVAGEADIDEIVKLIAGVFVADDPLALAAALSVAEFESFVRDFYPRLGSDSVTIVARAESDGELCGAVIADDAADSPPEGCAPANKLDAILELLGQLNADYRRGRVVQPKQALHVALLGVQRGWRGRGVGKGLVAECVANGRRRGFGSAVTEATSRTSQHIFRKAGFKRRVSRSYTHYRYAGRAPFAAVAQHGGVLLMDRALHPSPVVTRGGSMTGSGE